MESSVQKVIGEMRDNTDAAMISSIFWGFLYSVYFSQSLKDGELTRMILP